MSTGTWTRHLETEQFCEHFESVMGRVEWTASGWDAWVYIPENLRAGNATKHKVGECYKTALSAMNAVARQWRKYSPLQRTGS